jgi:P-type conjugative transfer protein TrbJ
MKKLCLLALVVIPVRAQIPGGGVFVCPTCAQEPTQVLVKAQTVAAYAKQLQQLSTAIQTYQEIVRAGQLLKGMRWTSATQDIMNIGMIAQQGQGIAFSMAALDKQFQAAYPGYNNPGTPYFAQYQKWSQTALDTIRGTVISSGASWQNMQAEQAMIQYFQSQAGNLTTQQQALMLGNVVGTETLSQMNKLRQIMLADMQSKQTFQAYQVQKEMQQQNYEQTFFAPGKAGRDGVGW